MKEPSPKTYKNYFTTLMFITEFFASLMLILTALSMTNINALILNGILAIIFTIITMALHIIVRIEELMNK